MKFLKRGTSELPCVQVSVSNSRGNLNKRKDEMIVFGDPNDSWPCSKSLISCERTHNRGKKTESRTQVTGYVYEHVVLPVVYLFWVSCVCKVNSEEFPASFVRAEDRESRHFYLLFVESLRRLQQTLFYYDTPSIVQKSYIVL